MRTQKSLFWSIAWQLARNTEPKEVQPRDTGYQLKLYDKYCSLSMAIDGKLDRLMDRERETWGYRPAKRLYVLCIFRAIHGGALFFSSFVEKA